MMLGIMDYRSLSLTFVSLASLLFASCASLGSVDQKAKDVKIPLSRAVHANSDRVAKSPSLIEGQIFKEINRHRSEKRQNPLFRSSYLNKLAREHSEYMRREAESMGNMTHISHDGFNDRFNLATGSGSYVTLSENVAMVIGVAEEYASLSLVEGWYDSKPHYKAIRGDFRDTGVGVVIGKDNSVYATQLFAR